VSDIKTHVRDSSGRFQHVDDVEGVGREAGGGQVGDDSQRGDLGGLTRNGGGKGHDHHGRKSKEPNWIEKKKYIFSIRSKNDLLAANKC